MQTRTRGEGNLLMGSSLGLKALLADILKYRLEDLGIDRQP